MRDPLLQTEATIRGYPIDFIKEKPWFVKPINFVAYYCASVYPRLHPRRFKQPPQPEQDIGLREPSGDLSLDQVYNSGKSLAGSDRYIDIGN